MADNGYFPRGESILRRVMEEKAVGLFYGQRSLCIGALKPLNYVGTSNHTKHKATPFRRLAHTGAMFEHVYFGTKAEADRTLRAVANMHGLVKGELHEEAAGHLPAGTPYSAHNPELMLWTVAVMVDSAEWFYERMVQPLSGAEREALWQDWLRFLELFGMPREQAPVTYRDFRTWFDGELAGPGLFLTDEARYMGYASAFEIPMPPSRRVGKPVHDVIMLRSLPERVRELYGLELTPKAAARADRLIGIHRAIHRISPSRMKRGSCIPEFDMVAAEERRRIERGEYTPQVSGDAGAARETAAAA